MATISNGERKIAVPDGAKGPALWEALSSIDVPFGCRNGCCHICETHVVSGLENLSAPTPREKILQEERGGDPQVRLMCQSLILGGEVQIEPVDSHPPIVTRKFPLPSKSPEQSPEQALDSPA